MSITPILPWESAVAEENGLTRDKAVVTELKYAFDALEPYISKEINELHYTKHHNTYAANYNKFVAEYDEAVKQNDVNSQKRLLSLLYFNAGGVINHNLWWNNLIPQKDGGGKPPPPESSLAKAIKTSYGELSNLTDEVNVTLAGIQGSGWAWIVKDRSTGSLHVITTPNQNIVPDNYIPIIGIDAWEHAYYLQYKNVKVDYFKAVWNIIDWTAAAKRFDA